MGNISFIILQILPNRCQYSLPNNLCILW